MCIRDSVHPAVPGDRVGRRLDVPVTNVQVARRVRVHRQQVVLRPRVVVEVRPVEAQLGPARLPARLRRRMVVVFDPGPFAGHVLGLSNAKRPPAARAKGRVCGADQGAGGATGVRTPDLLNAIQTLFQLSYSPPVSCLIRASDCDSTLTTTLSQTITVLEILVGQLWFITLSLIHISDPTRL